MLRVLSLSGRSYEVGVPDLDNIITHAFGYAYHITGNAAYRDVGTMVFNTALDNAATASPRHVCQQYRSSGHFPVYVGGVHI